MSMYGTWRTLAEWDWVVIQEDDEYIHAIAEVASTTDVEVDWGGPGSTACGLRSAWLSIPGLFSRMGAERCPKCCEATGMPQGRQSPKNDDACRSLVEKRLAQGGPMTTFKHWLVLGRDPDDSTFIVWDEQTADDHRETGYRVDGPFVPLAVAEKLAQALVPFVSLHNMASAFGSLTDEEFARLRVRTLLKAEAAADALAEFRAAHPREETP
jgi:hypothetical protein